LSIERKAILAKLVIYIAYHTELQMMLCMGGCRR